MFDFGIADVWTAVSCPGARPIWVVTFRNDDFLVFDAQTGRKSRFIRS